MRLWNRLGLSEATDHKEYAVIGRSENKVSFFRKVSLLDFTRYQIS